VSASDLDGTIIALSTAPALRPDLPFHWWAIEGEGNTIQRRPARPSDRFVAYSHVLTHNGLTGVSFDDLRKSTGWRRPYSVLTAEAVLLAAHLGFRGVELYGADWTQGGIHPPMRFVRESVEVWAAVHHTGLSVTRHGAPLCETPYLHFTVGNEVATPGDRIAHARTLARHAEVHQAVQRLARPGDVHEVGPGALFYIVGDSVAPVRVCLNRRLAAGWKIGDRPGVRMESGMMYALFAAV
jgi:hypothetical protein